MLIKINYNMVAFFLAIALVVTFCIVELVSPSSLQADITNVDSEVVELPVIMYHHLLKNQSRLGDYVISPTQFENDLRYIKEHGYTPISVQELLDYNEGKILLPEKPIMLTFDDGYEGVYEYAFPLLKKYKMKAVILIIGKHTDTFSNPNEPCNVNYAHISWEKLREMQESEIFEIGNHTYNLHDNQNGKRFGIKINKGEGIKHYREALDNDVLMLNKKIEDELKVNPIAFAYPYGIICKESKEILKDYGFKVLLTCEEKVNKLSKDSEYPINLKRFNRASHYSTYDFFSKFNKNE